MRCVCGNSYEICECRECSVLSVSEREICCFACGIYPALFPDLARAVREELGVV